MAFFVIAQIKCVREGKIEIGLTFFNTEFIMNWLSIKDIKFYN